MSRTLTVYSLVVLVMVTTSVCLEANLRFQAAQHSEAEVESLGGRITRKADGTADIISLEGPQVMDQHLVLLQAFPSVRVLDLDGSMVTDSGIQQLFNLPNLEEVSLRGTKVTAAAAKDLKDRHPKVYFVEVDPSGLQPRFLIAALMFTPIGLWGIWLIRLTQRKKMILPRHFFVRGMATGIFLIVVFAIFELIALLNLLGVNFHLSDLAG